MNNRQESLIGFYDFLDRAAGVGRWIGPVTQCIGVSTYAHGLPIAPSLIEAIGIGLVTTAVSEYERLRLRPRWLEDANSLGERVKIYAVGGLPRILGSAMAVHAGMGLGGREADVVTSLAIGSGINLVTEVSRRFRRHVETSILPALSSR